MKRYLILIFFLAVALCIFAQDSTGIAQNNKKQHDTTSRYIYNIGVIQTHDSVPTINLREVNIVSFKTPAEWMEYYQTKSRIETVLPYVKIATQLYTEIKGEKENVKKREYRHYRKDLEKEMRSKFEKELKDLTTSQGEMLFKLLNRETGNNAYSLIKEVKGPFNAWVYQIIGKRWGYDLKANYDPKKEKMIELIIKQMGTSYGI